MSDEPAPQLNGGIDASDVVDAVNALNALNAANAAKAANAADADETSANTSTHTKEPVAEASGPADAQPFSWLQPHPIFVIALVGPDETPFGIQKDFLCARSSFYGKFFDESPNENLENLVRLPDTPVEVFAYAQNFLYTGSVFPNLDNLPTYEVLIGVWKLGHELGIAGLCDATLGAMAECRRVTQHIPATPLLVQVWKDTPEGSSIRKLLLSWAAEYMRSSESRTEFARSLPQEVLSELVVAMSSLDSPPLGSVDALDGVLAPGARRRTASTAELDETEGRSAKKLRAPDAGPNGAPSSAVSQSSAGRKPGPRVSLPSSKPGPKPGAKRRASGAALASQHFSANQKLNFCADLLTRMLSGPGFWTRVVGPFKDPVDPERDGVPDYFDVVTKPMDLTSMKAKMDAREYNDESEFLADMNQIFTNCYTYWSDQDPMWAACEKLQKSFEDKFGQMNKWIAKMEGDEGH
ncbi:Bromodomain-containing protein [Trichocladium antarcticum]|uniref:Bromodomain-containing protein n=1 Tax=Trichocladium antarcticum TaxID=1450529 RepID=A0AAN6UBX9_9PEZI|nr:Bromodomain-containing protein [Trichocladium antarcticum]